jgi:hypothetical protein
VVALLQLKAALGRDEARKKFQWGHAYFYSISLVPSSLNNQ